MALAIVSPITQYFDLDGDPLDAGKLYFGAVSQNPLTAPVTVYWDAAATIPAAQPVRTANGYTVRNGTPAPLYAAADFSILVQDRKGRQVVYAANSAEFSNSASVLAALNTFISNLANTSNVAQGDALVGVKHTAIGAVATTQHAVNEHRELNAVIDFGCPTNGVTSATSAVQALFDAAAAGSVKEVFFPAGDYLLTNPRSDAAHTCAVIISGLRNCVIRGTKGTRFITSTGGAGVAQFGVFRIEQCENVEFCDFAVDWSGITITGTGGNRAFGIIAVNFNVNSESTDLAVSNKGLHFHHLRVSNSGGGITMARRSQTLAATPATNVLHVHDCIFENLLGVDHGVSCPHTNNVHVHNNRFVNDIATKTIQDNMAFDASSGCEVALFENNYVYGFVFGAKSETAVNVGPASNETRASKRVQFVNNIFDEIGDPFVLVWPGPSGGDTFGIKNNSQDAVTENNTVRARTIGVTAGGLGIGIISVNTHNADSHCRVETNRVKGAQYGIVHNDTTPTTRECSVSIEDNRLDDCVLYGILAQANAVVKENTILRAGRSAIICQTPNNSFFRKNIAVDCATTTNTITGSRVVFFQEGGGTYAGVMEWTDNIILDSRGGSAAQHGYFIQSGTTRTNALIFRPGYNSGLLTAVTFDRYFSIIEESLQLEGTTDRPPVTIRSSAVPSSTSPWSGMTWKVSDRAIREVQAVGQPKGWVCTVAGTPGTWTSEGNL